MRIILAIVLGIIAIAAAGVWVLGEVGGGASAPIEAREPLVREAEASDPQAASPQPASPPPASPQPASPQDDLALRSTPAEDILPPPPPAPLPAPEAAAEAAAEPEAAPAESTADAAESATPQPPAAAPRILTERLQREARTGDAAAAPALETREAAGPAPTPSAARTPSSPDAAPVTSPGVAAAFKSRRVTYNRPPERLILDRAIDVSLVINATDDADAGADALQGFPGTVVDRDVDLSDIVSAQLTGVGFDITAQTVERQKLSSRTINRWQWRVKPTEVGPRTLILEIFGYESGSLDAEPLDAYRDEIVVEVEQLDQVVRWARSVQPVFAVLAGVAGALSALFAFLRFREEKKRNIPPAA